MHEKTLLIGALTATALAAGLGVYKARSADRSPSHQIVPVSRLDPARPAPVQASEPIRLTSSDGTGLKLVSLKGSAAIEDPLALTELHLVFENPTDRILEGTFQITLPQGASLSRFAMKIGDSWQEGEVVEKQQARQAYEDFLHRRQDPALLEQTSGNEFSARVFPIPARGTKEIILAYSEVLEAGAAYVLPLRGLPALATLDIDVHAGPGSGRAEGQSFGLHQQAFAPAADFVVDARSLPRSAGLRNGELVLARVVPFATSRPDPVASAVVLVDTSASRSLGLAEQIALLGRVLAQLSPEARVTVACFDQEVVSIYEGEAGGFGAEHASAITRRGALGASDFQAAIAWAGQEAKRTGARRVVLVGDGVATAGETDSQALKREVEKLRASKVERLDAIAVGGIRDDAFLRALVRGVLDRDGAVLDAAIGAEGVARRLGEATSSGVPVKVEGATWSWPQTLDGFQAGDEVIVHAEIPPNAPVRIDVGGQQFTPDVRTAQRPLVERAWARAKIESLIEAPSADPSTTKAQIVALGTKHRVVSAHTAMLVLETDADYDRFGIQRGATTDILTVEGGRVSVLRESHRPREPAAVIDAPPPPPPTTPTVFASATAVPPPPPSSIAPGVHDGKRVVTKQPPAPKPAADPGVFDVSGTTTAANDKDGLDDKEEPRKREAKKEQAERAKPKYKQTPSSSAVVVAPVTPAPVAPVPVAKAPEPPSAPSPLPSHATRRPPAPNGQKILDRSDPWGAAPGDERRDEPAVAQQRKTTDAERAPEATRPAVVAVLPEAAPYEGRFKVVMDLLAKGEHAGAFDEASRWHTEQPGDVMALVGLGEALEARAEPRTAARAYGSILELYPSRADLRRFAGERLERLHARESNEAALRLAIDTYAKAAIERPDHPTGHHLLAFALLKHGEHEKAFETLRAAVLRPYPAGRFVGVDRVLREDLGLVAAAWTRAQPGRAQEIKERLRGAGGEEENGPSLRFVLVWETDANDVDFHIYDGRGGHAFYSQPELTSGGRLYADVTTGYGPECFTIRGPLDHRAYPYALQANYFSRGPMGYGMGKLELIDHDGKGNLVFEERPYVVMTDRAYVDLGRVEAKKTLPIAIAASAKSMK